MIYGDGAITPAISVLSALEGLKIVEPALQPYILPLTVAILIALFMIQPLGTAKIGCAFGPIMAVWFVTIALLGVWGIARHPAVLWALNPLFGLDYLRHSGGTGFLVLGGVFLCVTGAEALYADMGHFGAGPIKLAWSVLVFPSLVLNYAGQGALVLSGASTEGNIFYRLCPPALLLPLVLLSTVATIIASQSIITGAFSMTRQAIMLGWMPRLKISQTSAEGYGQIYVGAVNWLLMLVTVGLALSFRKSDNLAGAYGIAVSATMILTTVLLFIAMREILHWNRIVCLAVAGVFIIVDTAFFASNMLKLLEGGYVPLTLAAVVYLVMYIWHRGTRAISERLTERPVPVADFLAGLARDKVARAPGTAVFLTRVKSGTPPIVQWYAGHAHTLQQTVIAVTLETRSVPWVADDRRMQIDPVGANFWFVRAAHGFMERPDLPKLMELVAARGCSFTPGALTYFIGIERVVARDDGQGISRWLSLTFAAMLRNCSHVTDDLKIPAGQLVELGRTMSI